MADELKNYCGVKTIFFNRRKSAQSASKSSSLTNNQLSIINYQSNPRRGLRDLRGKTAFSPSSLTAHSSRLKAAFSLVELMIVVAVLGILAAIVLPDLTGHSQKAKEAAAKENLRILRDAIQNYAIHNKDVAPGYPSNNPNSTPISIIFVNQMTKNKPYLSSLPKNPFSGQKNVRLLSNGQTLDESTAATVPTNLCGWIYHPATKIVKLNWPGTDSEGKKYFDY